MPETIKEERLRWVLPIVKKKVKLVDAAKVCKHGKRSLGKWGQPPFFYHLAFQKDRHTRQLLNAPQSAYYYLI